MEIKSIHAGLPSIVSKIGQTDKGGKETETEKTSARKSPSQDETQKAPSVSSFEVSSYKAFFAVDENKNVVIRVMDDEGNVVQQIPPAEYLKMAETLSKSSQNLFHLEA